MNPNRDEIHSEEIPLYEPEIVGVGRYNPPPQKKRGRIWVNVVLFFATVLTTTLAGAFMEGGEKGGLIWFLRGFRFSLPLLLILGIHEMGHYTASKLHNINATLPYFIPAPTYIGTFGAFIKIKDPIVDRRALLDVGAAGPLAGFFAAIPVLVWGLLHSRVVPVPPEGPQLRLGSSLILSALTKLIWGDIPKGYDLYLSAPAFAGWIGLFVTSMNLLPISQLDGGHIAYALWGERANTISKIVFFALIPLGFFWTGWLFWAFLLAVFLKLRHPPVMNPYQELDPLRRAVGYFSIFVFIITFTPVPFAVK